MFLKLDKKKKNTIKKSCNQFSYWDKRNLHFFEQIMEPFLLFIFSQFFYSFLHDYLHPFSKSREHTTINSGGVKGIEYSVHERDRFTVKQPKRKRERMSSADSQWFTRAWVNVRHRTALNLIHTWRQCNGFRLLSKGHCVTEYWGNATVLDVRQAIKWRAANCSYKLPTVLWRENKGRVIITE